MKINDTNNYYITICAYKPDHRLVDLVQELKNATSTPIFIVFDGVPNLDIVYSFPNGDPQINYVILPTNGGKGNAMRFALTFLQEHNPKIQGVVFADADGQHTVPDIIKILKHLQNSDGQSLILGVRIFNKQRWMPSRSKIGNRYSNFILRHWFNIDLPDTQCGLRGVPVSMFATLNLLTYNHFDFELAQLIIAAKANRMIPVEVEAVYDKDNYSSTLKINKEWFRMFKVCWQYKFHYKKMPHFDKNKKYKF